MLLQLSVIIHPLSLRKITLPELCSYQEKIRRDQEIFSFFEAAWVISAAYCINILWRVCTDSALKDIILKGQPSEWSAHVIAHRAQDGTEKAGLFYQIQSEPVEALLEVLTIWVKITYDTLIF